MANLFTQAQVEAILRPYGFKGAATGGAAQTFINSNSAAKAAYDAAVKKATSSASTAKPVTATPTAPVAQPTTTVAQQQNLPANFGSAPMTVEPLNQWQKEALDMLANPGQLGQGGITEGIAAIKKMLANPSQFTAQFTNPQATQFNQQAADMVKSGVAPVTQEEVMGVANPFAEALKSKLSEAGARARASLTARQGMRGAASFGDSSFALRQGEIDRGLIQGGADIDYQTFRDALEQINTSRNRQVTGGSTMGSIAGNAQDVTSNAANIGLGAAGKLFDAGTSATETGFNAIKNKLGAGTAVQQYNQGVNDLIGQDITGQQDYERQMLDNLTALLGKYSGGSSVAVPTTNSLTKIGGTASALSGLLSQLSQTSANRLPWQQQGFVNPTTGLSY
jgi:hypothetical protein